jgi:hypothetical protein
MNLNRVIQKLSTDRFEGFASSRWQPDILVGSLRASLERSQPYRQLIAPTALDPIVHRLRGPDGRLYLLYNIEPDYTSHGFVHHLRPAPYTAEIYTLATTTAASGARRAPVETLATTVPCDYERTDSVNSTLPTGEFNQVVFYFPGDTTLGVDHLVKVAGMTFDIRNVLKENHLFVVEAVKR